MVRRARVTRPCAEAATLMGSTMREWLVDKVVYVNFEGDPRRHLFPYFVTLHDPDTKYACWGDANKAYGTIPMTEDTLEFID